MNGQESTIAEGSDNSGDEAAKADEIRAKITDTHTLNQPKYSKLSVFFSFFKRLQTNIKVSLGVPSEGGGGARRMLHGRKS